MREDFKMSIETVLAIVVAWTDYPPWRNIHRFNSLLNMVQHAKAPLSIAVEIYSDCVYVYTAVFPTDHGHKRPFLYASFTAFLNMNGHVNFLWLSGKR